MRPSPKAADTAYNSVLSAFASDDGQKISQALAHYFELLERSPELIGAELRRLHVLLGGLSSRLAALRRWNLGVCGFEDAHGLFWSEMTALVRSERCPPLEGEALEACCKKLMIRTVHFLRNRRHALFKDIVPFLEMLAQAKKAPPGASLETFLRLLPRLLPASDPGPWPPLSVENKTREPGPPAPAELASLPGPCREAIAEYVESERLAAILLAALAAGTCQATVSELRDHYIKATQAGPAAADPHALTDRFMVAGFIPPGHGLELPALVLWYMEGEHTHSEVIENVKGRYVHVSVARSGDGRSVRIQNLNTGKFLQGMQLPMDEGLVARMEQGLRASGGRYLVALVRANEPTVRMIWVNSDNIDFSGKVCEAFDALSEDEARGGRMLEELIRERPDLGEVNYQLALRKRAPGTPAAFEEARRLLLRELEINPASARALGSLAITTKLSGDVLVAIELYEQSLRRQPHAIDTQLSYAKALLAADPQGAAAKVIAALQHAYDLDPRRETTLGLLKALERDAGSDLRKFCVLAEIDTSVH